jgi:hypothetical protein
MKRVASCNAVLAFLLLLAAMPSPSPGQTAERVSRPISAVLRQPLPPEELGFSENDGEFVINGPTFIYHVQKGTGAIAAMCVVRDGRSVIEATGPADLQVDGYRLASPENTAKLSIVGQGKDKIVLRVEAVLRDAAKQRPDLSCSILHTFFNDGVVVSEVKLAAQADLAVEKAIVHRLPVHGEFGQYLHKNRNENGAHAARGPLPGAGNAVRFDTLTSCLQAYSPSAMLAIFTDGGAIHQSQKGLDTAVIEVAGSDGGNRSLVLSQYLVHVAPGDKPFVLKAGEAFTFRVGVAVAPNRSPHPRTHDLRMFTWIGDAKNPYPTDDEITQVAQLGFTLFQLHRAGTAGYPRPPAGEAERVAKKVHETGMLFLWEENPDLLYANAPTIQKLLAEGKWPLWQGFNYNGHYKASMDPYCDLIATCLAAPNGQAEYRLANIERMMEQLPVDGLMLDDNLAYDNCKLWKEHGHPRQVYDCLIELHEMNWRRRELMRSKCPHLALVSHNTQAFVLPVICDFDAHVYGEGYSFGAAENYWNTFVAPVRCLNAQGMIWPGDDEPNRCVTSIAYNYDLLTGGGQYNEIDWRMFLKKFPYAKGVSDREFRYVKTYNLAQYFFGMYESKAYSFADSAGLFCTTTPSTFASVYRNCVWGDWLIPIANMSPKDQTTSLKVISPQVLGIEPDKEYVLFDVLAHSARLVKGCQLQCGSDGNVPAEGLCNISIPGENVRLFYLRQVSADVPCHLWGGKRISESRIASASSPSEQEARAKTVRFSIQGPAHAQTTVWIGVARNGIGKVVVNGMVAQFFYDAAQDVAYGPVTFADEPLTVEVHGSPDGINQLPVRSVEADPLVLSGN